MTGGATGRARWWTALACAVVVLAACGDEPSVNVQPVIAGGGGDIDVGITVSGEGEVAGRPDTLTLALGVSLRRDKIGDAIADAADRADKVIQSLKSEGVAEKDVQTREYSVRPDYLYTPTGQTPNGYRVTNTVVAKIRTLPRAGAIIDKATAAGGADVVVQGVSFELEDAVALVQQARARAFNDARTKAEELAKLAGRTLGLPLSISEQLTSNPAVASAARASDNAGATPIEPGELTQRVAVVVRYAIA